MGLEAGVGRANSLGGRDAAAEAAYQALAQIDPQNVALAFVFASSEYDIQDILNGMIAQLGNVPLIGLSTSGEITSDGIHRRSVVVVLFGGEGVEARADWVSEFSENPLRAAEKMTTALQLNPAELGILFMVADGLQGGGQELLQSLSLPGYQITGCLAGGDLHRESTFQIGGSQAGSGGFAAAVISGANLKLGVGAGHGWRPAGANFKITGTRGSWIKSLDGKPASERYSNLFGRPARDWAFPPLNTLIRLYPLGIDQENGRSMLVRTPLRVEADGSLRMNADITDGAIGHLLVGRADLCIQAARKAAGDALQAISGAIPKMALVFVDTSWEMLLKGQPGSEIQAVQEVLGKNIPIAGGYTFGQMASLNGDMQPSLLNQHIMVVLVGEKV